MLKKKKVRELLHFLHQKHDEIELIKKAWYGFGESLRLSLYNHEIIQVIGYLPISRIQKADFAKFLVEQKLLRGFNFVYYGEFVSLYCFYCFAKKYYSIIITS